MRIFWDLNALRLRLAFICSVLQLGSAVVLRLAACCLLVLVFGVCCTYVHRGGVLGSRSVCVWAVGVGGWVEEGRNAGS